MILQIKNKANEQIFLLEIHFSFQALKNWWVRFKYFHMGGKERQSDWDEIISIDTNERIAQMMKPPKNMDSIYLSGRTPNDIDDASLIVSYKPKKQEGETFKERYNNLQIDFAKKIGTRKYKKLKQRVEAIKSKTFIECDICRAKPGSPELCGDCIRRRDEVAKNRKKK